MGSLGRKYKKLFGAQGLQTSTRTSLGSLGQLVLENHPGSTKSSLEPRASKQVLKTSLVSLWGSWSLKTIPEVQKAIWGFGGSWNPGPPKQVLKTSLVSLGQLVLENHPKSRKALWGFGGFCPGPPKQVLKTSLGSLGVLVIANHPKNTQALWGFRFEY